MAFGSMTGLFGQRDRFAIEVELESREGPHDFAHVVMWLGGERIGEPRDWSLVGTLRQFLRAFVSGVPRCPPELLGLPAPDAFDRIHALLVDEHPERVDYPWDRAAEYQRMVLSPNGSEPFDGYFAFLLTEEVRDRIVHRGPTGGPVSEAVLPPGELERVVQAFLEHPWSP
jgi:hypothetical protein